jgi:Chalcone isomerase-like
MKLAHRPAAWKNFGHSKSTPGPSRALSTQGILMQTWTRRTALALATTALLAAAGGVGAQTVDLAGAKFEPQMPLGGKTLSLNGAGIRYKAVFKVYAVGMYLPAKATSAKAAIEQQGPKRLHVVMLRDVNGSELGKNFAHHFEDNAAREEFTTSINQIFRFGELFATRKMLKAGESFTLDWLPGTGTVVSINGVPQGEPYTGFGFYSGMMKLWIGERDSAGVRAPLLGTAPEQYSRNER